MRLLTKMKSILAFASLLLASQAGAQEVLTLTMDKAIEIALSENPTMKVADDEIQLKQASKMESIWGLLPEANLVGQFTRTIEKQTFAMGDQQIKVGTKNSYNGGVSIGLPVFAPALYAAINLKKTDVELAVEKARGSRQDLINQVTKAYYQLLLAQDGYEVLQKSLAQSEENLRIVTAKYEQGRVSEYDKISADVQKRNLEPSVVSARNGVNLAKLQLKVLMGMTADVDIAVEGNLKDYEMVMFQRQLSANPLSLQNNSDLLQLGLNEKMLNKNLKLQYTNLMPTLSLSFQYMYTTLTDHFRFSEYKWNPYSTLGVSLSIPLFKGSNFSKIKQARIQLKQLGETKVNTERQLQMQVTSFVDNMQASTQQVISNKEAVAQAEKGRQIAEKRYDVGKGTILEFNNSELVLTQSKLAYNQSIYDYLVAKADLDKVLGRNDEEIEANK